MRLNLKKMSDKIKLFNKKTTLNCKGKIFDLSTPVVMGILNITPDSFYDGNRYCSIDKAIEQTGKMLSEGADIIDIGAVSSRPGASLLTMKEERERLIPVLKGIRQQFPDIIISVDTFRAEIARIAVEDFKVNLINDISAGELDKKMAETISFLKIPYIIMHMNGIPEDMQNNPEYGNVMLSLINYFKRKVFMLKQYDIRDIVIDPGFGFGKTLEHNYQILKNLQDLKIFELPILVGMSRKSMINKVLNCLPSDSLNGTTVVNVMALLNGADILRVHNVKEAVESVKIFNKYSSV